MSTISELISQATSQSELSNLLESDKIGIISILSYADGDSIYDGTTSAYQALSNAISAIPTEGGIIFLPSTANGGKYHIDSNLTIPKKVTLYFAYGATISVADSKQLTINGKVVNGNFDMGTLAILQGFQFENAEINTPYHGYYKNSTGSDVKIKDSVIDADNYGILLNASASGKNMDILYNKINSPNDPIEINTTGGLFSQIKIIGNTLNAEGTSGSSSSGFAVGIAKGKDILVCNNIIEHSRQEAIHIEDAQERIIVTNNIAKDCYEDGLRLINNASNKPIICSNNWFVKDSSNPSADSGIYVVFDVNGSRNLNVITGNIIDGFANGLRLDGVGGTSNVSDNVILNCTTAINNVFGSFYGENICSNCDTLVKGNSGSITGKIISETTPTTILDYIGTSGRLGATLLGFRYPYGSFSSSAAGINTKDLFDLPTRFKGKFSFTFSGNTNYFRFVVDASYDGTNLTTGEFFVNLSGVVSSISLTLNSTKLALRFYTASSITVNFDVNFDGEFYLNT